LNQQRAKGGVNFEGNNPLGTLAARKSKKKTK